MESATVVLTRTYGSDPNNYAMVGMSNSNENKDDKVDKLEVGEDHIHRAKEFVKQKDYESARQTLQDSFKYTDDENLATETDVGLADLFVSMMNEPGALEGDKKVYGLEAIKLFENVVSKKTKQQPIDEETFHVRHKLGNLHFDLGNDKEALKQYSMLVSDDTSGDEPSNSSTSELTQPNTGLERRADATVANKPAFQDWKEFYLFTNCPKKRNKSYFIDESTLGQLMYNVAMLYLKTKNYDKSNAKLEHVYRLKLLDTDPIPRIPDFDIIYHLGTSYFLSGNEYWAAVLLETYLREFERTVPRSTTHDVNLIHYRLARIYEKDAVTLALGHYFQYLVGAMNLTSQYPASIISHEIGEFKDTGHVVDVFERMGNLFLKEKIFHLAAHCLREVYLVSTKSDDEYDQKQALDSLEKICLCYSKIGLKESLVDEAWSLQELVRHSETMRNTNNLSVCVRKLAEYYESLGCLFADKKKDFCSGLTYFEKSLKLLDECEDKYDPKIEEIKATIASLYYLKGDYAKALISCDDAIERTLKSGNHHLRVKVLCTKGCICAKEQNGDECFAAFKEALRLKKSLLGNDHMDISRLLAMFASAFYDIGLFRQSIDCFLEAFNIQMLYEDKNGRWFELLHGIVKCYKMMKFYTSALATCVKIMQIQKEELRDTSDEVAYTLEIMGDIHHDRGGENDYLNAAELYRRSAYIVSVSQEGYNERLLDIYTKLGAVQLLMKDYSTSYKTYDLVVKSYELDSEGAKPLVLLDALQGQGDVFNMKEQYQRALGRYNKTIEYVNEIEPKAIGKGQKAKIKKLRIKILFKIGRLHYKSNDHMKALEILSEGFSILLDTRTSKLDYTHIFTCYYLFELGLTCKQLGDFETAKSNFEKAQTFINVIPYLSSCEEELQEKIDDELRNVRTKCKC